MVNNTLFVYFTLLNSARCSLQMPSFLLDVIVICFFTANPQGQAPRQRLPSSEWLDEPN